MEQQTAVIRQLVFVESSVSNPLKFTLTLPFVSYDMARQFIDELVRRYN